MAGAVVLVLVLVIGFPVAFLGGAAVLTGLFGWVLRSNADAEHEGSELIDLNR
jgi:hypothetical protein